MNKEEFISYVRGVIDCELEKIRIDFIQKNNRDGFESFELVGSLRLIKDALEKLNSDKKYN